MACLLVLSLPACSAQKPQGPNSPGDESDAEEFKEQRLRMVEQQIKARGIRNEAVLRAMSTVPRHRFVPARHASLAYEDHPLPIGHGQTISQPLIVAYMTEAAEISANEKVLEIGTGSGYQAAILGELAKEVYTIEIIPELAASASRILSELGYKNIHVKAGDGYLGWPEHAPFDGIVVTAAPDQVPQALVDQLALDGKMVIPVGTTNQQMVIVTKTRNGVVEQKTIPVRFVPMVSKPGGSESK
ncbi:MAG: protein-L-isoaspartate(D-aspartate) O-methyltransferase [Blastocatellia bacterium]